MHITQPMSDDQMMNSLHNDPFLRSGVKYTQCVTGPRYPQSRSRQVVRSALEFSPLPRRLWERGRG